MDVDNVTEPAVGDAVKVERDLPLARAIAACRANGRAVLPAAELMDIEGRAPVLATKIRHLEAELGAVRTQLVEARAIHETAAQGARELWARHEHVVEERDRLRSVAADFFWLMSAEGGECTCEPGDPCPLCRAREACDLESLPAPSRQVRLRHELEALRLARDAARSMHDAFEGHLAYLPRVVRDRLRPSLRVLGSIVKAAESAGRRYGGDEEAA